MRSVSIFTLIFFTISCQNSMNKEPAKHTNALITSTSPYLLQHANNPVDWYPWGKEALQKAKTEDKPILLSIGYSSCHWCHVMAHESFENDTIADIMNEHFVNIKLDREERPDIDQIYMDAVQVMGLNGGWPLNVFLFPDQKPFYGGTYFPPQNWKKLLEAVSKAYEADKEKLYESALNFTKSLNQREAEALGLGGASTDFGVNEISAAFEKLQSKFDSEWGGIKKAPKFPMPAIWQFLANYHYHTQDNKVLDHLKFTLDKIAMGGIYDHLGGGFSRYSVDGEWHVPHFEKMLYDNGQLLSLYANGYKITEDPYYEEVMKETAVWLQREMLSENGGFYAGMDADSEGEEGKYYVWTKDELRSLAKGQQENLMAYFDVTQGGNWEGKSVLRTLKRMSEFCEEKELDLENFRKLVAEFKSDALNVRERRIKPGMDTKIIAGWNGLTLTGLLDAYQATGDDQYLSLARDNARFLKENMVNGDGSVRRTFGSDIPAFLEDYGALIQAFIKYYETFFDEEYLGTARRLADYCMVQFYDSSDSLFYFTATSSEALIARKKEIFDNVIPSSNALMAENLLKLGLLFDEPTYKETAESMLNQVSELLTKEPEFMSYWNNVALTYLGQNAEVVIVGAAFERFGSEIHRSFIPDMTVMGTEKQSDLPLFEYKTTRGDETTVYVCYNKSCKQPVTSSELAIGQLLEITKLSN